MSWKVVHSAKQLNDLNSKLSSPDIETVDYSRQLGAFVAVANSGGFNVAARQLQMSPPLVTRLIADLEDRIGTRLYVPTMRPITEANLMLVEQMRQMSEFKIMQPLSELANHAILQPRD
ncbi:MAG: helix-turn-helix domain-containing protein [Hyphomicrobiaceae bacterium]